MARPIWSGSISFGLVNVPVKLFSAVSQREVHFHMLHDADGARIHNKRVCSADGEEVPYQHVVKGYEVSRGRYVTATSEELDSLDPKASKTIDIEDFVDLSEIDPIYYEHTYHLVPATGAEKPYALLLHAMKSKNKVAIARMVMRTKQYLCTVRPLDKALSLSTMNYADEIVHIDDIEDFAPLRAKPKDRELHLAEQLVESLASPFEPEKYKDEHRERVLAMLKQKAKGKEIVAPPPEKEQAKVVDLFEALKASLKSGRSEDSNRGERANGESRRSRTTRRAPARHVRRAAANRSAPSRRKGARSATRRKGARAAAG